MLLQNQTKLLQSCFRLYLKQNFYMSSKSNIHFDSRTQTNLHQKSSEQKPPLPPFTLETAIQKVRMAEDAWNSRDPARVSLAYTPYSYWRNRDQFFQGREAIVEFLTSKWRKELDYKLIKELWSFHGNRISVRFQYEWHNKENQWFRSYGNEQWEFDESGLMARREASINDVHIQEKDRKFTWTTSDGNFARPKDFPGLKELGL